MTVRLKGRDRVALITDAMRGAGLPMGIHTLGGLPVYCDGTTARLADGSLAGSLIALKEAVRNMVEWGFSPEDAVSMATHTPAEMFGLGDRLGRIAPGFTADLALFDKQWQALMVIIEGQQVYPGERTFGGAATPGES